MPRILDKFDNSIRDVPQVLYDQWIVQESRFGPAPDTTPTPAAVDADATTTASDLVGAGETANAAAAAQETVPPQET